jgi:hypothetical protein
MLAADSSNMSMIRGYLRTLGKERTAIQRFLLAHGKPFPAPKAWLRGADGVGANSVAATRTPAELFLITRSDSSIAKATS